jgi:signal transduction histidine kinase
MRPMTTHPDAVEPRLREILGGVAAFRVLALAWSFAVTVIDARSGVLDHRIAAFAVLAALTAWTALVGLWAQSRPSLLVRPVTIAADLAMAAALVVTDWVVYPGPHPQSFGSAWPVTAVAATGAVLGWRSGLVAGSGLGLVNLAAAGVAGRVDGRLLAVVGSLVLMTMTGTVAGWVAGRLRWADSRVEEARAREEFARTLHDGVLQTLAVVQRRSDDTSLVELAREQEWELRNFIGNGPRDATDLVSAVRKAAAWVERHHDVRVDLVVVEAPPTPVGPDAATVLTAIAGATTEALTNAAKHADASVVTVCVDRGERGGVLVTVNDDGRGFDVEATEATGVGTGLARSIRGRIDEVGGTVAIRSRPDRGTEVTLWVP